MNHVFRVVWNRALNLWVVASELVRGRVKSASSSSTINAPAMTRVRAAVLAALMFVPFSAFAAADVANVSFEDGTLAGWTAGGGTGTQNSTSYDSNGVGASVVTGMIDFYSEAGAEPNTHEWTVTPYGSYMASLQAGPQSNNVVAGMNALGLTSESQQDVASMMGRELGDLTNAAWLYQDLVLEAGDSFTMAWQYVSTDYQPYNDGSLTSLVNVNDPFALGVVNNQNAQFALLGATNLGTGSYSTGSYGATGWQVATYSVSTAGTYRLGFFTFNIDDDINSPVLLIDQAPGLTFDHGVPFGPVAPNPGSGAPTTPGIPTTAVIDDTMDTSELEGASDGAFEGGTLVVDADGTDVDLDFTIDGDGGTIDQNGHDATFSGVISDAAVGTPGHLTVSNGGNGGSVTLTGENTYTGTTTVDDGATLSLSGDGSIGGSDVINHGAFDIEGANGDVNVKSLTGSSTGDVALGDNSLVLTSSHGDFGGTIGGNGGVTVEGGSQTLSGENTYIGTTTIDDGATLALSGGGSIGGSDVVNHGIFDIEGANGDVDVKSLTGSGTGEVALGGNDLVLTDAHGNFGGTIGGNGGVTIEAGTQTLTGCNTYSGSTVIRAGSTLAVAGQGCVANSDVIADGTFDIAHADGDIDVRSLTGEGDVDLGDNGLVLTDADGDFAGTIGGRGGVTIEGGTQSLSGENTFTGGLTVNGGTLQVESDANLGGGTVSIGSGTLQTTGGFTSDNDFALTSPNSIVDTAGHDVTFNGNLSGDGALNKIGAGTLTLKGDNTQDGINVKGGAVEFDSDAALGRAGSVVTIADNTTLRPLDAMTISHEIYVDNTRSAVFDTNGFDITMAGEISGAGIVQKLGGGVLTLSGRNSAVLMQVQGGSIAVTSQEAAGAMGGDIYIGQDGKFSALSGMNVTQNVHVTGENARFETTGDAQVTLSGNVAGNACLIKSGGGRLDMRGGGSNAIGACIEQGDLAFNSTFAGNVWVYADGTASGSGRVEGAMDVRGILSPGNSPGALVVAGDVVQHAGSTFVADIDGRTAGNGAGHFDSLTLVGAGSVYTAAGELQPRLRGITGDATNTFAPSIGDTFALVRAEGGVEGSYDGLVQPNAGLPANSRFDVRYEANAVVLAVTPESYAAAMGTQNTAAVGGAIDAVRTVSGVRTTGDAARLQDSLMGLDVAGTASALELLDGEFHATARSVLADDARRVRDAVLDRMRGGRSPVERTQQPGDAVWAQVLAAGGSLDGDGNAAAADYNGSGVLIGAEHRFDGGWQVGAMASSERTDIDVAARASNGDTDTLHFGLYADRSWGAFGVRGGVGVAEHSINSARSVNLPGVSQRLVADYDAQTRQAYVEGGYSVEGTHGSLMPYLQFARVETRSDAFSETGGSFALDVAKEKTTLDVSTLGVRGELSLTSAGTGNGWFNLRGGLGWRHASGDVASEARMGWTSGGDFAVAGAPLAEDATVAEVGVAAWLSPRTLLELGYEGQYADEARDHQATARLSIRF
ncbi:autotransporter domain-containing protein [Lysobacter soli]|uniref:autotransporter domain-containing protein n=1 Tax=Lysobacter soli TaxID=453783 RepID=UPI00240F1AAB|nr:autotransporter domain-containing protein [Lysobacter soli]MDG2518475.1 autotransporter domain-containing protein [Lysobacter soli]